jgi:hypothetical protein
MRIGNQALVAQNNESAEEQNGNKDDTDHGPEQRLVQQPRDQAEHDLPRLPAREPA